MFKRMLQGSGAMAAVAAAVLLGTVSLQGAFAQTPSPQPPAQATAQAGSDQQEQQPSYTGSIQVPQDQAGRGEQDETTALKNLATVTADQAKAAALAQFPGATVQKVELDDENGALVYSVQLTDVTGKGQDVKVDAGNGKVLHVEADGPEDHEAGEGRGGAESAGVED